MVARMSVRNAPHPAITATLAGLATPSWCGTAAELLALLPAEARPASPAMLAVALKVLEPALLADGVRVSGKRQCKTGRRLITLSRGDDQMAKAVSVLLPVSASYAPARARLERRLRLSITWSGDMPAPGEGCAACGGVQWWKRHGFDSGRLSHVTRRRGQDIGRFHSHVQVCNG